MNGLDPQAYLTDIFTCIHDHPNKKLHQLLPWNWQPLAQTPEIKAA